MVSPVNPQDIENNKRLLEKEWMGEIEKGLNYLNPIIQEEFRVKGLFNWISEQIVSFGIQTYIKIAKNTAKLQMNIVFDCAMEIINKGNNVTNDEFNDVIDKYLPKFLKLDVLHSNAKKKHPLFKEIEESLKQEFVLRVKDTIRLLKARPANSRKTCSSIKDIYNAAYKNPEEMKEIQEKEFNFIKHRVKIIMENKDIINIPFGMRSKIFRIYQKGIQYTQDRYMDEIDLKFSMDNY
ncbi:MAG: hypothetical protein ACTSYS_15670 [Promethearchaeota archaeon]